MPMLMQRADNQYGWESPDAEKQSLAAKQMWYDTVGHGGHVPALRAAIETFGADRLCWHRLSWRAATFSFGRSSIFPDPRINQRCSINRRRNAERLFGLSR